MTTTTTDPVDASGAADVPDPSRGRGEGIFGRAYRGLTFGMVAITTLVAFEGMAVATAMPVAVRELNGMPAYAWAFAGFMVASMFATVVAGRLVDRLGVLLPVSLGAGLFAAGLVVGGTAQIMPVFVGGRMLQGLGAGGVLVATEVIVARAYPEALRPQAYSALTAAWIMPAMVGPVLAGALTEQASWRWVFLGLLPLVALSLAILLPRVRTLPQPAATSASAPARPGLIWLALAAAVGIGLLQYAGQRLEPIGILVAGLGIALVVASLPRLLPAGTFRFARGIPSIVLMRGILMGGLAGAEVFIPLMLVEHRQLSPSVAGLVLTVTSFGWFAGSWIQARPGVRLSRPQLVRIAAGLMALGVLLLIGTLSTVVPAWTAMIGWTLAGLGAGMSMASLFVLLFDLSPVEEQGANASAVTLADSLGQVTTVGLGGVIFAGLQGAVSGGLVFLPIYLLMALVLSVGVLTAGRLRPA